MYELFSSATVLHGHDLAVETCSVVYITGDDHLMISFCRDCQ